MQCDLRDTTQIAAALTAFGSDWDVLAYVAGLPGNRPDADVLKVNYHGARLMIDGLLPSMRPGGAVVVVASTAAVGWENNRDTLDSLLAATDSASVDRWRGDQDPSMAYYTSKQAIVLYAKQIAAQAWRRHGIRVNTVSPGPIETPILPDFETLMGKEMLDSVRAAVGRHGTVNDIVPAIAFLTSHDARWINGQDLQVDAGFTVSMFHDVAAESS